MEKVRNRMEKPETRDPDTKPFPKHDHIFRNGTNKTDYKCANITQQGDGKVVITLTPIERKVET